MHPMFLPEVEAFPAEGSRGEMMARLRAAGLPIPQIQHLFAFKTDRTDHLARFTHVAIRGPSPLSPAQREPMAEFTPRRNDCPF
jgi:hypothetical protein